MADPQEHTPPPESLAGWMRRWLRLPTVGLPDAKALLAAEEERRRALRQQLSDAIPERLKSLAGMATDYLGQQFTPSPEMTEVGTQLKAMTNGGPVYGPMARFGVDQFVDSTTPGGAAMNLDLPVGKLLGGVAGLGLIKGGLKVVEDTPRGLYSRVDDLLAKVGKDGVTPGRLAKLLRADANLAEEAAYRKLPDLIASRGGAKTTHARTITREELAAHLAANPAPIPKVKVLGDVPTNLIQQQDDLGARTAAAFDRAFPSATTHGQPWPGARLSQLEDMNARHWAWQAAGGDEAAMTKLNRLPISEEHRAAILDYGRLANETRVLNEHRLATYPRTRHSAYQLPGGENYRETLLTLPPPQDPAVLELRRAWNQANDELTAFRQANPLVEVEEGLGNPEYRRLIMARNDIDAHLTASENAQVAQQFQTSHFPDDPNLVVHTRSNERVLPTGERGRFLEEVQSDLHQKGEDVGYGPEMQVTAYYDSPSGPVPLGYGKTEAEAAAQVVPEWRGLVDVKFTTEKVAEGLPDLPFKKSWPDLGFKHELLQAANDPNAEWIGWTSGATQADRYNLRKQIDELKWYRDGDGYRISAKKDGEIVAQKTGMNPRQLSETVGKEMAAKITANQEQHGAMSGLDLEVGGGGMKHFYDQLFTSRAQKILRPFGGKVEQGTLKTPLYDIETQTKNLSGEAAMWYARLTPEMKARMVREGLPLSVLLGMIPLSQVGQPAPPQGPQ